MGKAVNHVQNTSIPKQAIAAFCEQHHIRKLSLFGSVLRDDFRLDSDIDVLIEFEPDSIVGFFEFITLQMELSQLFGRQVDLNTAEDLSRYFRQKVIDTAQVRYERD